MVADRPECLTGCVGIYGIMTRYRHTFSLRETRCLNTMRARDLCAVSQPTCYPSLLGQTLTRAFGGMDNPQWLVPRSCECRQDRYACQQAWRPCRRKEQMVMRCRDGAKVGCASLVRCHFRSASHKCSADHVAVSDHGLRNPWHICKLFLMIVQLIFYSSHYHLWLISSRDGVDLKTHPLAFDHPYPSDQDTISRS